MRPIANWAGLICRSHQHYHRQWLSNPEWSNSRRWACARNRWLFIPSSCIVQLLERLNGQLQVALRLRQSSYGFARNETEEDTKERKPSGMTIDDDGKGSNGVYWRAYIARRADGRATHPAFYGSSTSSRRYIGVSSASGTNQHRSVYFKWRVGALKE